MNSLQKVELEINTFVEKKRKIALMGMFQSCLVWKCLSALALLQQLFT